MTENRNKIVDQLSRVKLEVHTEPTAPDNTVVLLCRLKPYTSQDKELKFSTVILERFVKNVLIAARDADREWECRISRPWLLKDDDLRFTYDLTFRGDLEKAAAAIAKAADDTLDPTTGNRLPTRPRRRRGVSVSFAGG